MARTAEVAADERERPCSAKWLAKCDIAGQSLADAMQYTIEDKFDVSPERYWATFFDETFNRALWSHLDIGWELLRFERKGEGADLVIEREQRLTPNRELPGVMKKMVGGKLSYVETNVFRAKDNKMQSKTVPNFGADRIDTHGIFRLEVLGPTQVNRIWEGTVNCKIPLVGGKIEQYLADEVKQSYRKATEFQRKWIVDHPA